MKPLQRSIERAITIPDLPRRRLVPGSVWAVTIIKNEADIIGHTVRHLLAQGVNGLIVVDNLSTDATRGILEDLAAEDSRVHVGKDLTTAHHQGRKMSYLAHLAQQAGADWVIPFDADEHWYSIDGTVTDFLRRQSDNVIICEMYNSYPLPDEDSVHLDKVVAITRAPSGWRKVAFRSKGWVWLKDGNHEVHIAGSRGEGLRLLHYQYRSFEQYSRKVLGGAHSVAAAGSALHDGIALHWKRQAALTDSERLERWASYCSGTGGYEDDQSYGDRIHVSGPLTWAHWDPNGVTDSRHDVKRSDLLT